MDALTNRNDPLYVLLDELAVLQGELQELENEDLTQDERDELRRTTEGEIGAKLYDVAAKAERIHLALLHWKKTAESCRAEAKRLTKYAQCLDEAEDRLKRYVVMTMRSRGVVRLVGEHVSISLRPTKPPVEVVNVDALPSNLARVQVGMTLRKYNELCDEGHSFLSCSEPEPMKSLIAAALDRGEPILGVRREAEAFTIVRK